MDRLLYERKLYDFGRACWHITYPEFPFVDSWLGGCLAEHLEAMRLGQILRLIINAPPRTGKSMWDSVMLPAWVWTTEPWARFLYGSYGADLAERDSLFTRDLINSEWYHSYWGHVFQLSDDQDTKTHFRNTRRGARMATTVTGTRSTGHGTDWLIASDPLKAQDVRFEGKLDLVIRWWTKAMSTRGNNLATMRRLVSHQRLTDRDLSGYLLAERLGYEHLCLPMRYEPARYSLPATDMDRITPTSLQLRRPHLVDGPGGSGRREESDLLFPERLPESVVADLEKELQEDSGYQLQQRNSVVRGNMFRSEYLRPFRVGLKAGRPAIELNKGLAFETFYLDQCRWFQCVDTASTRKTWSDWSVFGTFGITPRYDLLIWHVWRLKLEVPEQFDALRMIRSGPCEYLHETRQFVPLGAWPFRLLFQAVEEKSSGIGLLQQAAAKGYALKVLQADQDKVQRAAPLAGQYRQRKVYHREGEDWFPAFKLELLAFPNGSYKDQVDVAAYAGILTLHDEILRGAVDEAHAAMAKGQEAEPDQSVVRVDLGGEDGDVFEMRFPDD